MLHAQPTQDILFISAPEILAIPIHENHESLIDLRSQQDIKFGPSPEVPNNLDYTKMRQSVYHKLLQAQKMLPHDIKFCLYEALRSLSLQQQLFQERYNIVKNLHPTWSHEEIFLETTRLVSPVINLNGSKNIPPHSTGAAVDIYLITNDGEVLDMGIRTEDWQQDVDGKFSATNSPYISLEAQKNRAIMNQVLTSVGFINYPTEYWHWSYGDRYWAYYAKQPYAIYDSIE